MFTQEQLKQLFDYRDDGVLVWKSPLGCKTKPGTVAGFLKKKSGYIEIGVGRKIYQAHRLIFMWHTGDSPGEVDHINRIRHDNRIENLRSITRSDNTANSSAVRASSGYRGVSWHKNHKYFQCRIRKNGLLIHLGEYADPVEASAVYEAARKELFPGVFNL